MKPLRTLRETALHETSLQNAIHLAAEDAFYLVENSGRRLEWAGLFDRTNVLSYKHITPSG